MKILFQRRAISYSIPKDEVLRVLQGEDADDIEEAVFLVRIFDGHPTLLIEPTSLFPEKSNTVLSSWIKPSYIFVLRRDGDAGRAIFVDSFDRRIVND